MAGAPIQLRQLARGAKIWSASPLWPAWGRRDCYEV